MQYKKRSFILSLCIHIILIGVFFHVCQKKPPKTPPLVFSIIPDNSHSTQQIKETDSLAFSGKKLEMENSTNLKDLLFTRKTGPPAEKKEPELSDSYKYFLDKERTRKRVLSVKLTKKDSLFALLLPDTSYPINHFFDPISEQIQKRNTGTTPLLLPLTGLLDSEKSEKPNPPRFNFIPTVTQIQLLNVLFEKNKATQLAIYENLDTDIPATAEMVDHELEFLVEKGFLSRKKISPEQLFMLFGIPIEMSKKNRLNPLYQYSVQVDKKKLMTYLQAQLYLLREKLNDSLEDAYSLQTQIQHLETCIILLAS